MTVYKIAALCALPLLMLFSLQTVVISWKRTGKIQIDYVEMMLNKYCIKPLPPDETVLAISEPPNWPIPVSIFLSGIYCIWLAEGAMFVSRYTREVASSPILAVLGGVSLLIFIFSCNVARLSVIVVTNRRVHICRFDSPIHEVTTLDLHSNSALSLEGNVMQIDGHKPIDFSIANRDEISSAILDAIAKQALQQETQEHIP